jgi:hypothetical protein
LHPCLSATYDYRPRAVGGPAIGYVLAVRVR